MGENSFASNSITDRNLQIIFYRSIHISVVHSSRKNGFSISKIKGREREKLDFIARHKNWFIF
jgi:hypothetical protein